MELYFLDHVCASQRYLVLTDPEFVECFKRETAGRLGATISKYKRNLVPAEGIGIRSPTESALVIDSIKREKRQKQRIRISEVHGGYTEGASVLWVPHSLCLSRCHM